MNKLLKTADVREIMDKYNREEISHSRMVEMLNERANKALELLNISGSAEQSAQITKTKLNEHLKAQFASANIMIEKSIEHGNKMGEHKNKGKAIAYKDIMDGIRYGEFD